MTNHPAYWLKQIEQALIQATEVPLWGSPPSFPWDSFSQQLSIALQTQGIKITSRGIQWMEGKDLNSGLGQKPHKISLQFAPLEGTVHWLMSSEDREKLSSLLLSSSSSVKGFGDSRFQEGFYQYLLLQVLHTLEENKTYPDLQPRITEDTPLPAESSLVCDVSISVKNVSLWGRLVFSPDFRASFKKLYLAKKPDLFSQDLTSQIDLTLKLEVGSCSLSPEQWKQVQIGDFIILDRCSYDPIHQKGTLSVVLEDAPLFRAKMKKNSFKILEYAFYYEEEKSMADDFIPDDEEKEEEESFSENEEEFAEDTNHLWSPKNGNAQDDTAEKMISSHDIPLVLVVEIDRIRMNLEKLLQLEPGNVIELSVRPEQGVNVTVNGKKVAKAELVKLGETLGLKILQIGSPTGS